MAINPLTGLDDGTWPGDPTGFAGAPPAAMPAPPAPPTPVAVPPQGTMAPGQADVPPEIAGAMQTLDQVNAVLGPGAATPPPAGGAAPAPAAPARPPLDGLMSGSTGQQRQAIQQQQVAGMEAGRQLDTQEQDLERRAGDLKVGTAATDAAAQNLQALRVQSEEDERAKVANLFAARQQEAQGASARARDEWVNAKPTDWFADPAKPGQRDDGKTLMTSLFIALGHIADQLNRGNGVQSNIGQQAMAVVDKKVEQHRTQEIQRIEQLHLKAQAAGADVDRLARERAAALAQIEDKYAGIQKRLEQEARAQRAQMGMDAAAIERDQAVVGRAKKTLEQEQRRLDALNGFVDRSTALEIQQQRANRIGRGKGTPAGPTEDDPYAGMTPNARYKAIADKEKSTIVDLNGNVMGEARNGPKAGKELTEAVASAQILSDLANRMKEWYQANGTVEVLNRAAVQEREGIIVDAAAALTVLKRTGVLNDSERKQYARVFDASAFSSVEDAGKALDAMVRRTNDNYMRQANAELKGGKPAQMEAVSQQPAANRMLPAGAEPITYKGIEGYRLLKGTNAAGKKVYEFVPWPGQ